MKNLRFAKDVNDIPYHLGDRVNGVGTFDCYKNGTLIYEEDRFILMFRGMRFEPTDQFEIITMDME